MGRTPAAKDTMCGGKICVRSGTRTKAAKVYHRGSG